MKTGPVLVKALLAAVFASSMLSAQVPKKQAAVKVEKIKIKDDDGNFQEGGTVYHDITNDTHISVAVEAEVSGFPAVPEGDDEDYAPSTFAWSVTVPQGSGSQAAFDDPNKLSTDLEFIDEPGTYQVSATTGGVSPAVTMTIVVAKVVQSPDKFWWFDGATPTGWPLKVTLTAEGLSQGTFNWVVTVGATKAHLGAQNGNEVELHGDNPSVDPDDVTIRLTHNGWVVTLFQTQVLKPDNLVHCDYDPEEPGMQDQHFMWLKDGNEGFTTYIWYDCKDQFGDSLPSADIPTNEKFTSGKQWDWANNDWPMPSELNWTANAIAFYDTVGAVFAATPGTLRPQTPVLGADKVLHFTGEFYYGSPTKGNGVKVLDLTWQFYQDHGAHVP